jgi:superfamily II DNA or RNA helicase
MTPQVLSAPASHAIRLGMSLRSLPLRPVLETSTDDLVRDFYIPALARSSTYDRGVGYFTSAWLRLAASGLVELAASGGTARFIVSPKLNAEDWAALRQGVDAQVEPTLRAALQRTLDQLERDLTVDTLGALAWMVADGLLEFRIAIPAGDLDGDFHDKFGIFRDVDGDVVAFHGSANDSERAFRNYESLDVFYSWADERDAARAQLHSERFARMWGRHDPNLRVYPLPEAIRRNLVQFTERTPRPYTPTVERATDERWRHQREALAEFLRRRHGVLEMATGTGKTRTAITILEELKTRDLIDTTVIIAYGTDLLDQWHRELVRHSSLPVYREYGSNHELLGYLNLGRGGVLLASRDALAEHIGRFPATLPERALLIADEVHRMGSAGMVSALSGHLERFAFTLGLSATPEREYDQAGNAFIEREIGPVIFRFGLKEAIERGILCEFDYVALPYAFSDDDRRAVRSAIARYHARLREGNPVPIESLYQEIARIRKLCTNKLPPFREYLRANPDLMERCLIFVETAEYGLLVQEILMQISGRFHTYYGDDDRANLRRFARGELGCLITCHRISEGIDIRSVNNVVIFSSARARLETVQRLGRCLRTDPANPDKRARVVDFVRVDDQDEHDPLAEPTADAEREAWLSDLAATRRAAHVAATAPPPHQTPFPAHVP